MIHETTIRLTRNRLSFCRSMIAETSMFIAKLQHHRRRFALMISVKSLRLSILLNITRRTRDVMNLVERVQRFLKKRGNGCVPVKRSPAVKTFEKLDPALQKFLCGHSRLVFLDKSRGRLLPGPGPIEKRCFRVVENRSRPSSF